MWADPKTCLTVPSSGLPTGRRASVYCFAPPCLLDANLSKAASRLIVSFVYSHDIVSRLSLGSICDLKNAASWLCDAEEANVGEGYTDVARRAQEFKNSKHPEGDSSWFIAIRKTLEANMQSSDLFPPGRIFWAMRDSDLHSFHRSQDIDDKNTVQKEADRLRLFEVLDAEKVFSQIVFARDMLSSHLPHTYDRVLHNLL
jgi:sn1-specific diacylglycerol lipase